MPDLPDDMEFLKALIKRLWEENERCKAENAELRRRLGLDSTNSHQPPSRDGYQKKTVAPGLPKEKGRRNGGQEGHKGKTLTQVDHPDRIEVHLPGQCQGCGRSFSTDDAYEVIQSRQVFDLPEPKLEVTEHQLGQVVCCGVVHQGDYPSGVSAPVQYGPGVRALVTMLSVDHKMPIEQISRLFEDLYGYDLNSGTVLEVLERGYEHSAPLEEAVKARLQETAIVHFDETGIRAAGQLYWLHTASTQDSTHLFVHKKRGREALNSEQSVLRDFKGTAVHDCWAPYFKFEEAHHVLCGAHLLRELNGLKENGRLWAEEMHEFLLDIYKRPRPTVASEVTFLILHVTGSNNGLGRLPEGDAEYRERNQANLAWLGQGFEHAKANNSHAILIMQQANIFPEFTPFPGTPQTPSGHADLREALQKQSSAFGKPVVLVHGDSHYFRVDKPLGPRPVRGVEVRRRWKTSPASRPSVPLTTTGWRPKWTRVIPTSSLSSNVW